MLGNRPWRWEHLIISCQDCYFIINTRRGGEADPDLISKQNWRKKTNLEMEIFIVRHDDVRTIQASWLILYITHHSWHIYRNKPSVFYNQPESITHIVLAIKPECGSFPPNWYYLYVIQFSIRSLVINRISFIVIISSTLTVNHQLDSDSLCIWTIKALYNT